MLEAVAVVTHCGSPYDFSELYMTVDKLRHCSRLPVVLLLVAVYNVSSHGVLNTVYHVEVMQYVGRGFA